tara:strand:- start:929 stop:1165 length:237 start_codon:yes stop_codon:yes gene_type:complete
MKKSIDITPTWEAIVPALLEAYASASPMKREDIRAEFLKMAKAVDAYARANEMKREEIGTEFLKMAKKHEQPQMPPLQ